MLGMKKIRSALPAWLEDRLPLSVVRKAVSEISRVLKPGGIACAWIPLFITDLDFNTLLATFGSVFPNSTLWYFDQMRTTFAILIGTPEPVRFDYERMARGFENKKVREDLAKIDGSTPTLDQRMAAARVLAGKVLPDLKSQELSVEDKRDKDVSELTEGELDAILQAAD